MLLSLKLSSFSFISHVHTHQQEQSYPKPTAKPKPTDVQIKTHKDPNQKSQIQRTLQGDRENSTNPVEGELRSSQLMGFGLMGLHNWWVSVWWVFTRERGRASVSWWVSIFTAAAGFLSFLSNGEIQVVFGCWVSFFIVARFLGFLLDGGYCCSSDAKGKSIDRTREKGVKNL